MSIEQFKSSLSEQAKDIKINLTNVLTEEGAQGLKFNQIYGVALACAYATEDFSLIEAVLLDGQQYLSSDEINAAKSAAIIMGMNNIYYRFIHLASDKTYASMPAKLRMNIIANPGIDKIDFELYCLAVSAINGCGMCIDAHVTTLTKSNIKQHAIQSAVRIAAVLNAAAVAIKIH